MESNKLIAEFMDGIISEDGWRVTLPMSDDDIRTYKEMNIPPIYYTNLKPIRYIGELEYHTSWDWLMPVVNKCIDIYHIEQKNDDLNFPFYDCMGDIDRTYKVVVEFIKEYNNE